jgi:hypothetical protein
MLTSGSMGKGKEATEVAPARGLPLPSGEVSWGCGRVLSARWAVGEPAGQGDVCRVSGGKCWSPSTAATGLGCLQPCRQSSLPALASVLPIASPVQIMARSARLRCCCLTTCDACGHERVRPLRLQVRLILRDSSMAASSAGLCSRLGLHFLFAKLVSRTLPQQRCLQLVSRTLAAMIFKLMCC